MVPYVPTWPRIESSTRLFRPSIRMPLLFAPSQLLSGAGRSEKRCQRLRNLVRFRRSFLASSVSKRLSGLTTRWPPPCPGYLLLGTLLGPVLPGKALFHPLAEWGVQES